MSNAYIDILTKNLEKRETQDKPLLSYAYVVLINFLAFAVYCTILIGYTLATVDFNIDQTQEALEIAISSAISKTDFMAFIIYIPSLVFIAKRIKRLNAFIERKKEWYQTIAQLVTEQQTDNKIANKLTSALHQNFARIKPISLKYFLSINVMVIPMSMNTSVSALVILNIIAWIAKLFIYELSLNNSWNRLQNFEYEFDNILSEVWKENNWIESSLSFTVDPRKERSYFVWFLYSLISFGIMGIIWDYRIHTDPNNMYAQFHEKEDQILEIVAQHLEEKTTVS